MAAFPGSGIISLSTIRAAGNTLQPGLYPTSAISLNDAFCRYTAARPGPGGIISLSDFYNKEPALIVNLDATATPGNYFVLKYGSAGNPRKMRIRIMPTGYTYLEALNGADGLVSTLMTFAYAGALGVQPVMSCCDISVTRLAWNGAGTVNTSFTTSHGSYWGNQLIGIEGNGVVACEATFAVSVIDAIFAGKVHSYTTTFRLEP